MKTTTKIPSLASLIKKAKFDWINPNIKDDLFKVPQEISTDYKVYDTETGISSEDVIKLMKKDGYRPANAWELVSYAIDGWNNKNWIVGLGSVGKVYGCRSVPCLDRRGSERGLRLGRFDDDWGPSYRFLAVRNLSSGTTSSDLIPREALEQAKAYVDERFARLLKALSEI